MKRLTYSKSVGDVLVAAGFHKSGRNRWLREVGEYLDAVDIQMGRDLKDLTVNLHLRNRVAKDLINASAPAGAPGLSYTLSKRLGLLEGRFDKWWNRSDPEGPAQVADAIKTHALPFLDGLHSLEALMTYLEPERETKWRDTTRRMELAITLARLGRNQDAIDLLSDPPKRIDGPWLATVENLRRRLESGEPMELSS